VIDASRRAFDAFKQATEGKMQQFNALFERHKQRQKEMKLNEEAILRNAAEIAHWRRKIKNNEKESREANDRLRQEKENLSLHFRELKELMDRFRKIEAGKLAEISVAFEDIHQNLSEKLRLAEKILKYSEMTRELETEREQVIPFPDSIVDTDPEIQRQMSQFKLQLKGDNKFVKESDLFDKFYRRYNKVLLEKLALSRERAALVQHNHRLKAMLKKYMNGTAIGQDLMDHPNTLFIVNQDTNAPLRRVERDLIPVVDAKLTVDAIKLQGYH
jgi:broad specificity phosphatase PhoE